MTLDNINILIDRIVELINRGEIFKSPEEFIEARRLLNNELRQALDELPAPEGLLWES
jgi:hypothetical protein